MVNRQWFARSAVYLVSFVFLVLSACSDGGVGVKPGDESEQGSGTNSDGAKSENTTNQENTTQHENPTQQENPTNTEKPTTNENPTNTEKTEQESTGKEPGGKETITSDAGESVTPDAIVKEGTQEGAAEGDPACVQKGGYCTLFTETCRTGYADSPDTLECPGGRSAKCCVPSQGSCQQEGEIFKLGAGQCCKGLTAGPVATPPSCVSTGIERICVNCGDGVCDSAKGENACSCPKDCTTATQCRNHCDCDQGLMCANGQCLPGTKAVYCCSKPGCPAGTACTNPDGTNGTCPAATDCSNKGGQCVRQGSTCPPSYQIDSASCGPNLSLMCCSPVANACKDASDCTKPSCFNDGASDCIQIAYACTNSQCVGSKKLVNNAYCEATTQQCTARSATCKSNVDCPSPSCANTSAGCAQTSYSCTNGTCVSVVSNIQAAKCNVTTGKCETSAACSVDCDCSQGLLCANGQCLSGFAPAYCCTKAGCPAGVQCSNPDGSRGTCPVTSNDCTDKKGICIIQNSTCPKGYKLDGTVLCGAVRSLWCCLPANACTSDTDCPKPSCADSSSGCVQTKYACTNGSCTGTSATQAGTICNAATGLCEKPQCKTDCDCDQGLMCANGRCLSGIVATYCCSKAGCPAGNTCTNPDGTRGTCPVTTDCSKKGGYCTAQFTPCRTGYKLDGSVSCGGALSLVCCLPANACTSDTDCPKASCADSSNGCVQTKHTCTNGSCTGTSTVQAGTICNAATGLCEKAQCRVDCDCAQGLMCTNGQCIAAFLPVYCCTKAGCPAGNICSNPDGTRGTCPATSTDCEKKGGQCVTQGNLCPKGYKLDTTVSCGSILSRQCCLPATNVCTSDTDCPKATCSTSSTGCTQTKYACQNGACNGTSTSLAGYICNATTGLCEKPQCTKDSDCGTNTCSGTGVCTQIIYSCQNGTCQKQQLSQPNASCDPRTGQCVPLTVGCRTHCDCAQGQMCAITSIGGGQCVTPTKPVYCCTKTGCPAGSACTNPDGSSGTCPGTSNDCLNKGGQCVSQFQACPSGFKKDTTVSCGGALSLECCVPSSDRCTQNSDCGSPSCSQADITTCVQNIPVCTSSGLCSVSSTKVKGTCNARTGTCAPILPSP